jgi:hypothetical protein
MSRPVIQSVGLPPEKHADRVVAEMLRFIAREQQARRARPPLVHKAISDGSPKAQARMVERIRRSGGPIVIDVKLTPGKRGRYLIELYDWCVWDDQRGIEINPGDAIPNRPWLACNVTGIEGIGDSERRVESHNALFVTHHALSRLAQRCGARTVDDLIAAAKALWRAYYAYRMTMIPGAPTPDGTRIAVDLPAGMGRAVAVTRQHEEGGLIVATIIEGEGRDTALDA